MFDNIPPVVKNLLIINGLLYLAAISLGDVNTSNPTYQYLSLYQLGDPNFSPYQLFTYMFMHANMTHLLFNMFPLLIFGKTLEKVWGSKKFLKYYIITGIGAGIVQLIVGGFGITVGASGAIFGLLVAFGMLFPNTELFLLFPPVPIKAKYFVIGYALIELFAGVFPSQGDNVAHFAHLGGAVCGFIILQYWKKNSNTFY